MAMWQKEDDTFDLYGERQVEIERRVISSSFSELTDSIIDTHSAVKVLAVTVTAEIGAFAMFYVAKDKVLNSLSESDVDIWVYGGVAVFLIGFLTAFAAYRLIANKWPHQSAFVMIWLASLAAGLLNLGLFYVMVSFQMK